MTTDESGGDIDWYDYADVYGDDSDEVLSTIIEAAETKAQRMLIDRELERIRDNDESGEIEANAKKIAEMVGGDVDNYLVLSNAMSSKLPNADPIGINYAMIYLQVNLNCSQSQSDEIVRLFI